MSESDIRRDERQRIADLVEDFDDWQWVNRADHECRCDWVDTNGSLTKIAQFIRTSEPE